MPLDLSILSRQVRLMSTSVSADLDDRRERQSLALGRYLEESQSYLEWAQAVDLSRDNSAWLLARPVEPLNMVYALPPCPTNYALVATDGSQIDVERHGMIACYVINIGRVFLRYGQEASARLSSQPLLYFREEELYISDGIRRVAIEGNYLSLRRDVEEGIALAALAAEFLNNDLPAIALQDGTLVRWTLAGAEKFVQDYFLQPYLSYLDTMRELGIPVASYISRPRAPEVAGSIRLMFCPDVDLANGQGANCHKCSDQQAGRALSCGICQSLTDADILADMLSDGQRGPLFVSMSRINIEAYGPHLIHFFYMRVGREIARVEIPRWVAEDETMLQHVHTLVYDQCMRGQGYPVALARAHEQAIVRGADRRAFLSIVEGSLLRSGLATTDSRKREMKGRQAL